MVSRLFDVHIVRLADGAEVVDDFDGYGREPREVSRGRWEHVDTGHRATWEEHEYWWTEGNMACDCNRHLSHGRVRGDDESVEHVCGERERYVIYVTHRDGRVLYDERLK